MTDKQRRALSVGTKDDLIRVSKRIPGLKNRTLITTGGTGSFVVGSIEASRVLLIPVPTDHRIDNYLSWNEQKSLSEFLGKYITETTERAFRISSENVQFPDGFLDRHQAVFIFLDPFLDFQNPLGHPFYSFVLATGEIDISELYHWGPETLSDGNIVRAWWTDAIESTALALEAIPVDEGSHPRR